MSDGWYYAQGGERFGPMPDADIRAAIADGKVADAALVWKDGMTDWMPIRDSVFGTLFPSRPPLPGESRSAAGAGAAPAAPSGGFRPAGGTSGTGPGGPGEPRGFGEAVSVCFSKYVDFEGRASRSEFWYFVLFNWIVSVVIYFATASFGLPDATSGIWSLAVLLPTLAVGARRLHDTDRSAWHLLWFLLPVIGTLILIVFFVQRPTPGRNRFDLRMNR